MATTRIATRLISVRRKLRFLHGNLRWVIVWPIVAIILGGVGWHLLLSSFDAERQQIEANAVKAAAALSRGYAAQLSRTVEVVDQLLLHVKYEWGLAHGQLSLENIQAQGLFPPSSVFNVSIIDRNGKLLTSGVPGKTDLTLEDRRYFTVHKSADEDSLYIGPPVISRLSDKRVIFFSRRLEAGDGSFDGVALVSVIPAYFTANYDIVTLGSNGLLAIVGDDHAIRAARIGPAADKSGAAALLSAPDFNRAAGSALLNGEKWFSDGRSRYVGWDTLEAYPLVAMAGLDQQDVLAPYWAHRAALVQEAIWATVGLAVLTFIAIGFSMRLAWRKHQLEATQATYRIATEGGNEGFYIARPIHDLNGTIVDFEIVDSNQRGAQFLRRRREELIGKRISTLYEGARSERLMKILQEAMEAGILESDVEVPGDRTLAGRWAHLRIVRANGGLAVTLRDISDAKAHVEELVRRSNEDTLTGLPNRHWVQSYLPEAIEHAATNKAMLALLFVDLDGFKKVNDTAGHAAGDEVLRNAAQRLKDAVRPHDYVARLGGDEFVVILEQLAHKADAAHVADRILQTFQQSFRIGHAVHSLGASIGISLFPSDGADADMLLRNADVAMYSVKASGKGNYHFFDQKFYDALRTRLQQEAELRHAIEHDQFVMYYQPRVEISTGVTSSMESLVRWAHPTKGLQSPLGFIPLAEETGLILGLGELVINKVCAQLAYWAQRGEQLVPVSINVSARQFREVDIARILSATLERHRISPALVEIEVTESSMMGSGSEVSATLTAIRGMGIKLLVDDFGTGYSSLSQLQRLDFDVLKVDRAFTMEIDRSEKGSVFFKAIITMAHALGMRVVAEGVENEVQVKILKSLHCDEIQGFYISKPLPPSETQPILPKRLFPPTA
jgi:diguanylate cyclase (GGDEF)-like protein